MGHAFELATQVSEDKELITLETIALVGHIIVGRHTTDDWKVI